jgi:hypothetical protein
MILMTTSCGIWSVLYIIVTSVCCFDFSGFATAFFSKEVGLLTVLLLFSQFIVIILWGFNKKCPFHWPWQFMDLVIAYSEPNKKKGWML